MRKSLTVLLVLTMTLGACATRFNPMNWFGRGQPVQVENTNPLIPAGGAFAKKPKTYRGTLVGTVEELVIERMPGGAIIRATTVAPQHGSFDVQLTPDNDDEKPVDGVLTYRFEALQPRPLIAPGSAYSRQITAARHVTEQQLDGVRSIKVIGASNARIARR